jgi:hypothetical protein
MKLKQLLVITLFGLMIFTAGSGFASDKIMVDKEEYEQLKAAVKFLMDEREANKQAVEEAKQAAEAAAVSAQEASEVAEEATEVAVEATEVAEAAAEASENPLLEKFENLSIGGYGEVHYNNWSAEDSANDVDEIDIHRFVLFFGYSFTDNLRFFSEFEIEHGVAGEDKNGEVEVEQAYIEYDFNESTSALGGIFLLPIGFLNETHEPETFYGVERNTVENIIIPTTWWEAGAMITHRIDPGFEINAAMHSGLEIPTTIPATARVRSGRQKASEADASYFAYTGSVAYTGLPGLYVSGAVQYQNDVTQMRGDGLDEGFLWNANLQYEYNIFQLRALYAAWSFEGSCKTAMCSNIEDTKFDDQDGWYIEPSVKPFSGIDLGFFTRFEDTKGGRIQDRFEQWSLGLNYWLHPTVVLKADYVDREYDDSDYGDENDFDGYNLGIGWSF